MAARRRGDAVARPAVQIDQRRPQQRNVVNGVVRVPSGRTVRAGAGPDVRRAGQMLGAGKEIAPGFRGGFQIKGAAGVNMRQAGVAPASIRPPNRCR